MISKSKHLLSSGGFFLAMKGKKSELELSQLTEGYRVSNLYRLNVPQVNAERHLVKIVEDPKMTLQVIG
jgi:16S rRNA (guanine527-N7)-methyltransferase